MTPQDIVRIFAENWKHLRAWGRPLTEVKISIVKSRNANDYASGQCHPTLRKVIIRCGRELSPNLDTAIHELAHCVADDHHGPKWREVYARAIEEVTGIAIPGAADDTYQAVRALAVEALREWAMSNDSIKSLIQITRGAPN